MVHYKNFKQDASKTDALYFVAECGKDWYESQKEFAQKTIKLVYNSNLLITQADTDVSKLFPSNSSVVEVEASALPKDFYKLIHTRGFGYYDGKIELYKPSNEDLLYLRTVLLNVTDGYVQKHKEQKEICATCKLTDSQYTELLTYRQNLRDLRQRDFVIPIPPSFLNVPRVYDLEG